LLRLSATPEVPLPSIRDIDVKNQPTMTVEQSMSFRVKLRGEGISETKRNDEHGPMSVWSSQAYKEYIKMRMYDVIEGRHERGR
jgi:hypothetical protein